MFAQIVITQSRRVLFVLLQHHSHKKWPALQAPVMSASKSFDCELARLVEHKTRGKLGKSLCEAIPKNGDIFNKSFVNKKNSLWCSSTYFVETVSKWQNLVQSVIFLETYIMMN